MEDGSRGMLPGVLVDASRRAKGVVAQLCHRMRQTMDDGPDGFFLLESAGAIHQFSAPERLRNKSAD